MYELTDASTCGPFPPLSYPGWSNPAGDTRVVTAVEPRLLGDSLSGVLANEPGMQIVGAVRAPEELSAAVLATNANVVIHSWPEGPILSRIISRLFFVRPNLRVLRIDADNGRSWLTGSAVLTMPLVSNSLAAILTSLRRAPSDSASQATSLTSPPFAN